MLCSPFPCTQYLQTRRTQRQYGLAQSMLSMIQERGFDRSKWKLTSFLSHQEAHLQDNIFFAHRPPEDWSDWVALKMVRSLRRGMDFATGYKHHVTSPAMADDNKPQTKTNPHGMTEEKWLTRFVFLESVAGVPGMVAGMLRHLHSLRRLKKDNGWWGRSLILWRVSIC